MINSEQNIVLDDACQFMNFEDTDDTKNVTHRFCATRGKKDRAMVVTWYLYVR